VAQYAAAADLAEEHLRAIAEDFADGPTAILVGWGMQRRAHGAATVRALDALSAISGNLFRSGGGCSFYFRRRGAFDVAGLVSGPAAAPRVIREPLFAADVAAAADPPVRAIWVTAGNPVAMLPDAAAVARVFERTEFTVVVDPFLTDTGRRASLVLPVPTMLEDSDLLGAYGHHWLAESQPVVPPPDGVLHEVELFAALARRVGLEAQMAGSIDDYKRRLLRPVADLGASLEALREGPVRNPLARERLFDRPEVCTESRRVQLLDELPPRAAAPEGYPLWLFSNSTEKSQASQWSGQGLGRHTWISVHPQAARGLEPGAIVTVESPTGRLRAELRLDPSLRTDVAVMPKGGHYDAGHSANVLIAAKPTDRGLGAAFLDCRVRIG
jgi:anaerobic selenocysteine-containing dehydrogenase